MSSAAIAPCKWKKVYGFRSFLHPGCPIDVGRAFRDNIRLFLSECAESLNYAVEGMPVWVTMLVDEKSGVGIPLYSVEEEVQIHHRPFCDYCRCTGWSHHFVSKRRYHLIIPMDSLWGRPLSGEIFGLQNHLLHALIHCNGFGHLICINGHEAGSNHISGSDIMDLFDRICSVLRTREITVDDTSRKKSMEKRLLYGVAYGKTWFGKWGYEFCHGSYGITKPIYDRAIDILGTLGLDNVLEHLRKLGSVHREVRAIVENYRRRSETQILTLRDLLRSMLELKSQMPLPVVISNERVLLGSATLSPSKKRTPNKQRFRLPNYHQQQQKKKKKKKKKNTTKSRKFSAVAAELDSRWSVNRMKQTAGVVVQVLCENRAREGIGDRMTRQAVRDAARLKIGDTGLLDFVLKSLGDCVVGDYVVRRTVNPTTRTMEFSVEEYYYYDVKEKESHPVDAGSTISTTKSWTPIKVASSSSSSSEDAADYIEAMKAPTERAEVYRDIVRVYKWVLEVNPGPGEMVREAVKVLLDTRHFSKTWPFHDDDDAMLRYFCRYIPSSPLERDECLYRGVPVDELVVVQPYATTEDLRAAGESALRDTYVVMDGFAAASVEITEEAEAEEEKEEEEKVLFGAVESGARVWLRGQGLDTKSELRYEGGEADWKVDCRCGARDDDGERMVACDICEVWQHTRCAGIGDGEAVPTLFVCASCGSMLVDPEAQHPHELEYYY